MDGTSRYYLWSLFLTGRASYRSGHGGVEALTIGAVLGFSFIVWLGLMTVAA